MDTTYLVVKNATYGTNGSAVIASADYIDTLADGAIVAVTENGAVIPAAGTFPATCKHFNFILKTSQGYIRSSLIERATLEASKVAYVAPVNMVQVVTINNASPTVGKSATLMIYPLALANPAINEIEDYTVAVTSGASLTSIVAAIVTKINASSKLVTATSSAGVITLTGKANIGFNAIGANTFLGSTSSITTAFKNGVGTYAQIAKAELEASAHKGNMRSISWTEEMYKQAMQTASGNTYIQYKLNWTMSKKDVLQSQGAPYIQQATIAFPSGNSTLITALDAIIAAAIA